MLVHTEGARVASILVHVLSTAVGAGLIVTSGGMVVNRIGAYAGTGSVNMLCFRTGATRAAVRMLCLTTLEVSGFTGVVFSGVPFRILKSTAKGNIIIITTISKVIPDASKGEKVVISPLPPIAGLVTVFVNIPIHRGGYLRKHLIIS